MTSIASREGLARPVRCGLTFNLSKSCLLVFLGVAATPPCSLANILTQGALSAGPDLFTNTANFTIVAATGPQDINPSPATGSFNATYRETVVRDNSGTGLCLGCLDFLIEVVNAGPGIFERVTTASFDSFITDVGYNFTLSSLIPCGVIPGKIDRSLDGNVVGFNFIPGAVSAGQHTVVLEIQTNARFFKTGTVSIQDGTSGFAAGFAPSAVPEPALMILIGACLLAIGFLKKLKGGEN